MLERDAEWRDDATCGQIGGDLWFPEKGNKAKEAREICADCPVIAECLRFALNDPTIHHGIWAGKSPRELRDIRRLEGLPGAMLPEDMEPDDETAYEAD